jgi:hypothetical protein
VAFRGERGTTAVDELSALNGTGARCNDRTLQTPSGSVPFDRWTHIAMVFDAYTNCMAIDRLTPCYPETRPMCPTFPCMQPMQPRTEARYPAPSTISNRRRATRPSGSSSFRAP